MRKTPILAAMAVLVLGQGFGTSAALAQQFQTPGGISSNPLAPPGSPSLSGVPQGTAQGAPQTTQPRPQRPPPGAPKPATTAAKPGTAPTTGAAPAGPGQGMPGAQGSGAQGQGEQVPAGAPSTTTDSEGDVLVLPPPQQKIPNPYAVFAGLDKITGRITSFDVAINETVQFGALQVTPRACYTRPPTESQNTTAFAEVNEVTLKGEAKRIFTGWMFASSPGLHGVEHPIYDVWLTDCKASKPVTARPAGQ